MKAKVNVNRVQINGQYYTAVHGDGVTDCSKCAFKDRDCMGMVLHCIGGERADGKPVYYIKNGFYATDY